MELNNLLHYRKLAPGIVLLVLAIPLMYDNVTDLQDFVEGLNLKDLLFLISILVIGTIYQSLKLTDIIWDPVRTDIDNNIKNQILNEFNYNEKERGSLRKGKTLINIFFQIIDNDESLKQKKKRVYANGLILTTLSDIGVISVMYAIFSTILGLAINNLYNIILAYAYFAIFAIAILLINLRTKAHKSLGDDQLEVILRSKRTELKSKLDEALQSMSK